MQKIIVFWFLLLTGAVASVLHNVVISKNIFVKLLSIALVCAILSPSTFAVVISGSVEAASDGFTPEGATVTVYYDSGSPNFQTTVHSGQWSLDCPSTYPWSPSYIIIEKENGLTGAVRKAYIAKGEITPFWSLVNYKWSMSSCSVPTLKLQEMPTLSVQAFPSEIRLTLPDPLYTLGGQFLGSSMFISRSTDNINFVPIISLAYPQWPYIYDRAVSDNQTYYYSLGLGCSIFPLTVTSAYFSASTGCVPAPALIPSCTVLPASDGFTPDLASVTFYGGRRAHNSSFENWPEPAAALDSVISSNTSISLLNNQYKLVYPIKCYWGDQIAGQLFIEKDNGLLGVNRKSYFAYNHFIPQIASETWPTLQLQEVPNPTVFSAPDGIRITLVGRDDGSTPFKLFSGFNLYRSYDDVDYTLISSNLVGDALYLSPMVTFIDTTVSSGQTVYYASQQLYPFIEKGVGGIYYVTSNYFSTAVKSEGVASYSYIIENFENTLLDMGIQTDWNGTPQWTWNAADGLVDYRVPFFNPYTPPAQKHSLQVSGQAGSSGPSHSDYYAGYVSNYIATTRPYGWTKTPYLHLRINNGGQPNDKIKVELYETDSPSYFLDNDDKWIYEVPFHSVNSWQDIYIPFLQFTDDNPLTGNNVWDPISQGFSGPGGLVSLGGVKMIGFALLSGTAAGSVSMNIDLIELVSAMPTTDSDVDGMPDAWEITYGLNPNDPSDAKQDADRDGYTNLQEYIMGTNPLQPMTSQTLLIDSFEGNGPVWSAYDNLALTMVPDAVGILDPYGARITTMSMHMIGYAATFPVFPGFGLTDPLPASGASGYDFYTGRMEANIADATTDWSQYKSIKFIAKNSGSAGDRFVISLRDNDNSNASINEEAGSAGDDMWEYTQVINANGTWNYYTVLLPTATSLNGWVDANPNTGNGVVDLAPSGIYPGVLQIGISNRKFRYYGLTDMSIDHIELSQETNSNDNDGDGLPNEWEDLYFGVSSNAKNIATGDYGADGNPDGDSDSNIREYWLGTIPTQKAGFPELATFEPYPWPGGLNIYISVYSRDLWKSDDPARAVNVLLSTDTSGSGGVNSLLMSGTASNYYAGFVGGYTAQGLPYSWTGYKYLKLLVKNSGTVGDKLKIQLKDNDTNVYSADADDAFEYEISTLKAGQWQEITVPLSFFTDTNPGVGNDIWDPATGTNPDSGVMGGVKYMGFALLAGSASGKVTFNIDNLMLVNTPNTADTNGDGLPDWWSVLLGISVTDSSLANGPMGDLDNDGMPNILEYMNLTSPKVVNSTLAHGVDNIPNSWKINYGLSLNADVSLDDPDGDGIDNYHEYLIGSSPLMHNNLYTSHNNIPDFWQIAYTGTTNILNNPAGKDTDGDGVTDYNAYLQGINPNLPKVQVGPGWNLLSISYSGPVDALIAAINTQNNIIGAAKWFYNGTAYEWLDYRTGAASPFTVIQNEAIYVESTGVFSFIPPPAPSSVTTYNFVVGWNPMSRVLGSSLTIQQLKDSIDPRPLGTEPHKLVAVAVYRGGAWNVYNFVTQTATGPIALSLSEALSRHAGYMLNFASNVDWKLAN